MSGVNNSLTTNQNNSKNSRGNAIAVREAQEVQAQMIIAQQFPRNEEALVRRINNACMSVDLAKKAIYSYPRGGVAVEGPSIRLAEAIAQNYGNLDFGIIEVENREGESVVKAYCTDLETNTRSVKVFSVPHARYSRAKGLTKLTDPRDIYEMVANNGARRLRSCILAVIPGHITENAINVCKDTLVNKYDKVVFLAALNKLVGYGATQGMIEKRFGKNVQSFTPQDAVKIMTIVNSIEAGMSGVVDWFEKDDQKKIDVKNTIAKKQKPKKQEPVGEEDIKNLFNKGNKGA